MRASTPTINLQYFGNTLLCMLSAEAPTTVVSETPRYLRYTTLIEVYILYIANQCWCVSHVSKQQSHVCLSLLWRVLGYTHHSDFHLFFAVFVPTAPCLLPLMSITTTPCHVCTTHVMPVTTTLSVTTTSCLLPHAYTPFCS